jgi:hypothetical protein
MLIQSGLPLAEPSGHPLLGGLASVFFQRAAAAGDRLDLLSQSAGFVELSQAVGVDLVAQAA